MPWKWKGEVSKQGSGILKTDKDNKTASTLRHFVPLG